MILYFFLMVSLEKCLNSRLRRGAWALLHPIALTMWYHSQYIFFFCPPGKKQTEFCCIYQLQQRAELRKQEQQLPCLSVKSKARTTPFCPHSEAS